jgi:hypothetical protein
MGVNVSNTNNKSNLLIKSFDIENGLLRTERDTFLLLLGQMSLENMVRMLLYIFAYG